MSVPMSPAQELTLEQIASDAVQQALAGGATDAECTISEGEEFSVSVRMQEAGAPADHASVSALMAMLERAAYFLLSRRLDFDTDTTLDTLTLIVHRGFFAAPAVLTPTA